MDERDILIFDFEFSRDILYFYSTQITTRNIQSPQMIHRAYVCKRDDDRIACLAKHYLSCIHSEGGVFHKQESAEIALSLGKYQQWHKTMFDIKLMPVIIYPWPNYWFYHEV